MKHKVILLLTVRFLCHAGAAYGQWTDRLALYLPNRVMDLLDSFTLNIGGGPTLHAELYATHACKVGGGLGYSFLLMKDHNRQYGYAAQNGYGIFLPGLIEEDTERGPASPFVNKYWFNYTGFPKLSDPMFDPEKGSRDYWEFGGSLGAGILDVTVSIHPIEILDAVLGFFFIDIRNDDMTFENFK